MASETKIYYLCSLSKKEYKATGHVLKAMKIMGNLVSVSEEGYCKDDDCYFHKIECIPFYYDQVRNFQNLVLNN